MHIDRRSPACPLCGTSVALDMPIAFAVHEPGRSPRTMTFAQPQIRIGGSSSSHRGDLRLHDARVDSSLHAGVTIEGPNEIHLHNASGSVSLYVNGEALEPSHLRRLDSGDEIVAGDTRMVVEFESRSVRDESGCPGPSLIDEVRRLGRVFEQVDLSYAFCGALAAALYGAPQPIDGIDVLIGKKAIKSLQLSDALRCAGYHHVPRPQGESAEPRRAWSRFDGHRDRKVGMVPAIGALETFLDDRARLELPTGPLSVLSFRTLVALRELVANEPELTSYAELAIGRRDLEPLEPPAHRLQVVLRERFAALHRT
jgi:hypothetical protein